jgi:hypothetical protein
MKTFQRSLAGAFLAIPLLTSTAVSQMCAGFASLHRTPFQVGVGAAVNADASGFGAAFTAGNAGFGSLGLGTTHYDDLDGSSFDLAVGGGYEFPLDAGQRAFVCPSGSFSASFGPNDILGSGIDLHTIGFAFGFSLGGSAYHNSAFELLPSASLDIAYAKATLDDNAGNSLSSSDTYGLLGLSVGLVLSRVFTLRPSLSVPFALDNSNVSLGIALAYNFGHRGSFRAPQ